MTTSIRPIKTESDYKDALMRVDSLMDAQSTQSVNDELQRKKLLLLDEFEIIGL